MTEPRKSRLKFRKPSDGDERQILVTIGPETIEAIKTAAIEDGTASSEVMEAAAVQWLQQKKNKRPGSLNG